MQSFYAQQWPGESGKSGVCQWVDASLKTFPAAVKEQKRHGSREMYERVERTGPAGDRLGPQEQEYIGERDSFYMGSTSESGWPYIQYCGGEAGFLHMLDVPTLGFADLHGNKQYISLGNLKHDDRVALFLRDYANRRRLKILGRAEVHEGDSEARGLIESCRLQGEIARLRATAR